MPLKISPLIWSTEAGYFQQVGGKIGKPTLRLDINPLALTPDGLNYLRGMLNGILMLPWPWWGYARVSRIDMAVDHGVSRSPTGYGTCPSAQPARRSVVSTKSGPSTRAPRRAVPS